MKKLIIPREKFAGSLVPLYIGLIANLTETMSYDTPDDDSVAFVFTELEWPMAKRFVKRLIDWDDTMVKDVVVYHVGDKVRIIDNTVCHGFDIGDIVRIAKVISDEEYVAESNGTGLSWYIVYGDIEPVSISG